ncbi:MAG: hypothetical protein GXY24_06505 [Bacteroidales bacterium]|jgi:hypothetical protein|nr:hypothetical protein [Bacteroidales bacterium]
MKTLEEIEKLSIEELEQAAAASPAPVPAGLKNGIRQALAAHELANATPRTRPARWVPLAALAVAAAAAAVVVLPQRGPKDTFDDPRLAYAEMEKAFQLISDKMSVGADLAREARTVSENTLNILDNIQSK